MASTLESIKRAESLWKSTLINYLQHLYRNTHLPSHDLNHHLRVWEYCKQLLLELDKVGGLCYNFTVEQVLVACLFHDTGLIYDRGERHGYQSRLICEQFFNEYPSLTIDGFDMVLHAIEHHDDKSVKSGEGGNAQQVDLVTLVSTADDLDAVGLIGVFRYIEIYSLRGVSDQLMPIRVIDNIRNRHANFSRNFSFINDFSENHHKRYSDALTFFENLQHEQKADCKQQGDYIQITQLLVDCLINQQIDVDSTIQKGISESSNPVVETFFKGLRNELLDFKID